MFRGSAYCQVIRSENKAKRLEWARLHQGDRFEDAIFTDESSIQLESHRRFCCRKGEPPKNKPRLVSHFMQPCSLFICHADQKVHVWGGLSFRGPTGICIFEGIMDADMYVDILEKTLIPFINKVFPDGHRFIPKT